MRLTVAATIVCMMLAQHAIAQNNVVVINGGGRIGAVSDKPQTVMVTFQLTMPAPATASSTDMTNAMAATNQSLYDIVNHECEVLAAALKGTCRLIRLNVGGNFAEAGGNPTLGNRGNGPVVNANANATFEIEPAAADVARPATPPPPAKP
jgi:hypothetical protein